MKVLYHLSYSDRLIKECNYNIQLRGDITIKGKGIMRTYFVLSGNQVEIKEVETVVNDTRNNHHGQIRSQQWVIVEENKEDKVSHKPIYEFNTSAQCDASVQVNLEDQNGVSTNSKPPVAKAANNHSSKDDRHNAMTGKNKARSSMCAVL